MVENGHLTLPRSAVAIALLVGASVGLAASAAIFPAPAYANKVGVAAAVNPDAFSSLSQVPNKQLNIGKSIFYNERIETSAQGLVQVLLVDGSTFTVGPNSNLVIDKFVYDPKKKSGEMVATFSKGSMRFIGGKLSKNAGGVKVNTPDGALAIRGGMFQGNTQKKIYSFLFGHSMTMQGRNGQTQTVYQPGYTLDLSRGSGTVRPTTAEDTNVFMQALSSPNSNTASAGGGGGDGGSQNPNSTAQQSGQQADNISNGASETISNVTTTQIQTEITKQLVRLEQLRKDPVPPPNVIPFPTPQQQEPKGPKPPIVVVEPPQVVKTGGTFEGFASGFLQTSNVDHDEPGHGQPDFLENGTVVVMLDPDENTVTAKIAANHVQTVKKKESVEVPGYLTWLLGRYVKLSVKSDTTTNFNLGYLGSGDAAYVSDDTFLALGDDGSTSVSRRISRFGEAKFNTWYGQYRIRHSPRDQNIGYESVTNVGNFANVPNAPLCNKCDFLRYGLWSSNVTYDKNADNMGGWWVASNDVVGSVGQLPTQGNAYYAGNAVGTFARKIEGDYWQQGLANGGVSLDWNFEARSGKLQVTDFGNQLGRKSFGGTVSSPEAVVGFAGDIRNGAKGTMRGTFVGARPDLAPQAVMGDFNARGGNWRANGIYGASHVPNLPQ